jgi:hypothetical protein
MTYTQEVIYDPEHKCYLLTFSEELLNNLGWKIGDTLVWSYDGTHISLRKLEDQSTKT